LRLFGAAVGEGIPAAPTGDFPVQGPQAAPTRRGPWVPSPKSPPKTGAQWLDGCFRGYILGWGLEMACANGKFKYSARARVRSESLTLGELVERVHRVYSRSMEWKQVLLRPGTYGYDNLAICIGNSINKGSALTPAEVFESWKENHVFWAAKKPYLDKPGLYSKPYNDLEGERYAKCLGSFAELPEVEKIKHTRLALALREVLWK